MGDKIGKSTFRISKHPIKKIRKILESEIKGEVKDLTKALTGKIPEAVESAVKRRQSYMKYWKSGKEKHLEE